MVTGVDNSAPMPVSCLSLLDQFNNWGNQRIKQINIPYFSKDQTLLDLMGQDNSQIGQNAIFFHDFYRYIHDLSTHIKYRLAFFAQAITIIVIAPFSLLGEIYRLSTRSINASICLLNIVKILLYVLASSAAGIFLNIVMIPKQLVYATSIGTGFLTWHAGEKVVSLIRGSCDTVLSNKDKTRDIVYNSLGLTVLAAGAVFIPWAPIQMIALPIILGSIYGAINNQFTVRQCPEYYTMDHNYDGTNLRRHAIKSNNVLIKPIVTGCYATTTVTQVAGLVFALVGTLPYTQAMLPVSLVATMIAGTCVIALIAAHIFSTIKKKILEKKLNQYAQLIGIQWNEVDKNQSWQELMAVRLDCIIAKQNPLASDFDQLRRVTRLEQAIQKDILDPKVPVKYSVGWHANHARNQVGYLFAGGGTLAIAVTGVFLRIFIL